MPRSENYQQTSRTYFLPAPPDVRNVVELHPEPAAARIPLVQLAQTLADRLGPDPQMKKRDEIRRAATVAQQPRAAGNEISPENTTLIGDRGIMGFKNPDSKWLVQHFPKALIATITNRINKTKLKS